MLVFDLLDLTPYGRQETWEESPPGWPQDPTYSWMQLKDRYGESDTWCCRGHENDLTGFTVQRDA